MMLRFDVIGEPVGEPRHRAAVTKDGKLRTYRDARADEWKGYVRGAATRALYRVQGIRTPTPVFSEAPAYAWMEFKLSRPKSHWTKGGSLRRSTPRFPGKPDADNLAKAVMDALGSWPKGEPPIAWADDAIVVTLWTSKRYAQPAEPPGVSVWLSDRPLWIALPSSRDAAQVLQSAHQPRGAAGHEEMR